MRLKQYAIKSPSLRLTAAMKPILLFLSSRVATTNPSPRRKNGRVRSILPPCNRGAFGHSNTWLEESKARPSSYPWRIGKCFRARQRDGGIRRKKLRTQSHMLRPMKKVVGLTSISDGFFEIHHRFAFSQLDFATEMLRPATGSSTDISKATLCRLRERLLLVHFDHGASPCCDIPNRASSTDGEPK